MSEHYIPVAAMNRNPYMRFVWGLIALAAIMAIGSIGYKIIGGEKATWIDCIYMTFITIASIGYGEIIDLSNSPGGRVFTIFVGFAGIGVWPPICCLLSRPSCLKAKSTKRSGGTAWKKTSIS